MPKWITIRTYVDLETGESIDKKELRNYTINNRRMKTYQTKNFYVKELIIELIKSKQLQLWTA